MALAVVLALHASAANAQAPGGAAPAGPAGPAAATAESAAGDKAMKAHDFAGALGHFQASVQANPTPHAQLGMADALYQLGRATEAYGAYSDAEDLYGSKLAGGDKTTVLARLKELAQKTGALSIHVEEPGSEVTLDGKSIGTSPLAALVRVTVGSHEVRVTRAGFLPFATQADVQADGKAVVDAVPLVAQPTRGHVVVHASGSEPLRVIVDGLDLGATPWEGDLPSGPHEIAGRSSTQTAMTQTVNLAAGDKIAIALVASSTAAHLQVTTSDGKGTVFVDGVNKGQGSFAGDVAPGVHSLVVDEAGFQRFEKTVTLGERETWAETVTLRPSEAATKNAGIAPDRPYEGLYGGFGLAGAFGVNHQGTDVDSNCSGLGATGCDTGQPLGGGGFAYVGWTWDPVGFELMLAGSADTIGETAHFSQTGQNAASFNAYPPRTEDFRSVRVGGMAALRVRASTQWKWIRGTVAGGLGVSYKKIIWFHRETHTTDGSNEYDLYVPDVGGVSYLSPAVSVEAAAHFRVAPNVAIAVGLEMWADNASISGTNSVPASPGRRVGNTSTGATQEIATPAYTLASGPQVSLLPFIGMQFGP